MKRRYLVFLLGLIIMFSGIIGAASIQTGFGTVVVSEVDFQAADGSMIHSTLQKPIYAADSNPLPGVVVIHGSLQSKEWLMAFGIELAKRGFVVLTIDANGHGNSDPGSGSGTAALEYITSLDYVDDTQIGLIGHSMGGGIALSAIEESSVYVRALVFVGSGFWTEPDYTPNTLVAVGYFDSLSSYPQNLTGLEPYFNVTGIVPGTTYGDFANNTARRVIFAPTNHLFETINPIIISETVDWMKNSLKGGVEDEYWIASTSLVYPFWLAGGLFGLLGALLTVFPLIAILLDIPVFSELKGEPKEKPTTTRSFIGYGIVLGLIGTITFFPFLFVGTLLSYVIPFPQSYGIPVMSWMIGSALFAALFLFIILTRKATKQRQLQDGTIGVEEVQILSVKRLLGTGSDKPVLVIFRTLAIALIVFVWLYMLALIADLGLVLDLRSFLPGLHDLTLAQATFVPLYFIVFLIYTLIDGAWLTGPMLPSAEGTWTRVQFIWTAKAVLIKTLPYLILLAFEFVGGYLAGAPLIPGIIGYSFLFFYAFTPWFAICTVITMFVYRVTGNRWLGAMINAIICAWLLASILALR